ncbi:hypothetical protein SAMN04489712_115170 [Thermomonospora echinospora]|uniref:DUF1152 domain-containing protein n=1 Tax=Thermomonospora echinospora TaxID=1992 RepID=A0A1H6DF56_9ACTN|nr:DUF1152 domain-containing protein [Thermomonospora echinospora]SEG83206.1 hypothetical protein SAMN04489712_115170 [Thermomonospora echinospora]
MTRLYVAAGGGGDALAAAIIHAATSSEPAYIATFAWDRLLIDPLPGPRSARDFTGLHRLGEHVTAITPDTRPIPPAGSTLPRLAAEINATLVLLDPTNGATGLRAQLRDLAALLAVPRAEVIDVGGDALAHGDEPGLRSPLADALALSACHDLGIPVGVLIAGPGLDGEIPEPDVLARVGNTMAARLHQADADRYAHVFDWHPSEATALLAAAARGARGTAEVRDSGLPVTLTDHSPNAYRLTLAQALSINTPARAIQHTTSLDQAEEITRTLCGFSEIDYERAKATRNRPATHTTITEDLDRKARAYERDAAARGIDFLTFRRLAEVLGLSATVTGHLRTHLIATRPAHYLPPIWATRPLH